MNDMNEKDTRVTIRDLFFYILRKWRIIVIMGFGFAFLFGVCREIKLLLMVQSDEYKGEMHYENAMEERESEIENLDRKIVSLEKRQKEKRQYQEQSMLMSMDPYDSWIASADVYISGSSGTSAAVLSDIYQHAINNGSISQKLAEKLNMDEKYIREMIKADYQECTTEYSDKDQAYITTDQVLLHIGLIADDKDMARELMDGIVLGLNELSVELNDSGESERINNLTIINDICTNRIVEELEDYQNSVRDTIEGISDELNSCQKEKDELVQEVYKIPWSAKEIVLSGFKFFLLGGFIGGCLSLIILLFACLYSDKILSPNELRKQTGLNVIMVSKPKNKHSGTIIDKFVVSHELSGELLFSKSMQRLLELDNAVERYVIWGDWGKEVLDMLFPDSRQKTVLNMDEMESWRCLLPEKGQGKGERTKYILVVDRERTTYREINNKLEVIRRLDGQDIMLVVCV